MDMQLFIRNRQQFPLEELAKYAGKYIAWSPDGASILAADEDELRLAGTLEAAGFDMAEICIGSVPAEDTIIGGGFIVIDTLDEQPDRQDADGAE